MSQSQKAVAAILLMYLVYTTMRGNLANWLRILGLKREPLPVGSDKLQLRGSLP